MSHLNKKYSWPYNLAYEILEGDERIDEILPKALIMVVETDLTEREKKCIFCRYMDLKNYDEIGKEFGVTRERIRQILAKAIRKLRHPHRSNKFLAVSRYEYNELQQENAMLKSYLKEIEENLRLPANEDPFVVLPFMATPIEELNLSVRSYNCLARRGKIKTYGDLVNYKISDFMRIRNLGLKSLDEILKKLSDLGFKACHGDKIYDLKDYTADYYSDDILVWGK